MRIVPLTLLAFACLALLLGKAQTQELPKASAVATQIGQAAEFQDDVKAVSYSRSTKGYYLSFGAPYPKQILSVWIEGEMYERLPSHKSMVGRTVRISGQIEKSPTGPLIKLESKDHFQVLETDEAILSKPTLDGKQDRSQFESAVWQTFKREDFNTLEVLSQELQQSRERLNDGSWLSESFFNAFRLGDKTSDERYAEVEQILARWEQARPASPVLSLIKANYHVDLAWKWRGVDYTVTPQGRAGFKKELAIARELLDAHPSAKVYPEYFACMQKVALGQFWSKTDYERLFAEATSIEPDYYSFYYNKAVYLLPRWHGRKGEWEAFAEQVRQQHGAGGAGDAFYARIAWALRDYYDCNGLFRDSDISWEKVASGYEYLIRQYPDSRYLKSLYANLAWKADDRVRLRQALPAIKSDPDMTIWVNLENVALAEKFAASGAGR